MTFPILFLNAMIRNIKIHNNLDIIEVSKSIELNKCIHKNIDENFYLHVSYGFSKFDVYRKIKV
jgi:hypothetical protein